MNYENEIELLKNENRELRRKVELLEFRTELLAEGTDVASFLIESNIDREQYTKIMNLMDEYRRKIDNGDEVSHGDFEMQIAEIIGRHDYHFAELITKLFMEENRWEEVFPALYGDSLKYKGCLENAE